MDDTDTEFSFTPEGKLRHENAYLQSRINNLETFKKHFFTQQHELEKAGEQIKRLEQQLGLDAVRQQIVTDDNKEDSLSNQFDQFLQQSHDKNSFDEIAALAFQAMSGWTDSADLLISANNQTHHYSLDKTTKAAHHQKMLQYKDKGEQVNAEPHLILNHEHISIMAQLPDAIDEKQRSHRQKFLQLIGLSTNARLDFIVKNEELEELRKNIYQIFKRTNQAFEDLQDDIAMHSIGVSELFINMETKLTTTLQKTPLPARHGETIKQLISSTKSDLNVLLTSSMTLDEDFLNILKKLESAYSQKYGNEE